MFKALDLGAMEFIAKPGRTDLAAARGKFGAICCRKYGPYMTSGWTIFRPEFMPKARCHGV